MIFQNLYDALVELLQDKDNREGKMLKQTGGILWDSNFLTIDLKDCGSSVHQLFETTLETVLFSLGIIQYDNLLSRAIALIDYCNEAILLYHFKDVPVCWRRMLMDAGLLKVLIQLGSFNEEEKTTDFKPVLEPRVQSIMSDLDTCCVVSGSPGPERRFLSNIILDQLQTWLTNKRQTRIKEPSYKKFKRSPPKKKESITLNYPIKRLTEPPSFEWFLQYCNQQVPTPFIMPKGVIDDWPAFHQHPWGSMDYLLSVAADRVVPVEIGNQYTDSNWGQKMMRFSDFIQEYILREKTHDGEELPPAYLAQHDVFYQIPRLEQDIIVPDYCYIEADLTEFYSNRTNDVVKNAWFGPKGTISPLHQDPYHNLLAQVVGSKYLKLISPEQTELVYPREGLMTNTSQVDIEHYNHKRFPRFKEANYVECILEEGEILYIPPKWWHFVKSLETSFSVSLWF